MDPMIRPHRGGEVKVGNVYTNPHGKSFYKVVVGIVDTSTVRGRRPWNNVVCLHINISGDVVGSSNQPVTYVSEHQDLIGFVKDMPSLKIEWLTEKQRRK